MTPATARRPLVALASVAVVLGLASEAAALQKTVVRAEIERHEVPQTA